MVKSYLRFEPLSVFGVIASNSNVLWIPSDSSSSSSKDKSGGRAIVAGLEELLVWDLKTATLQSRWSDSDSQSSTGAPKAEICRLEYAPTADLVASGYTDGSIKIWDFKSGTVLVNFTGHKSAVTRLTFTDDETRLISGSRDSNIVVWDLIEETGIMKLRGHQNEITGLGLLGEENQYLLSTSKDGQMKVWDLELKTCIETHVAHAGNECWALGLSLDKDIAFTACQGKELRVWSVDVNAVEGSMIKELGRLEKASGERALSIKYHKNGHYIGIANNDRSVEVYRVRTEDEVKKAFVRRKKRIEKKKQELSNGADGDEIYDSKSDDNDEANEEEKRAEIEVNLRYVPLSIIRTTSRVRGFDWTDSTKGSQISFVTALANNSLDTYRISTESRKSGAEYTKQYTVDGPGHRSDIRSLALSSDDKLVASASNGLLKVWNVKTRNCLRTFETGYVLCHKFLPGDALIVAGTKAGDIELYDVASSSLVTSVSGHDGASIWSLDISADGQTLVTGGADKKVKFWNFKVEQELILGTTRTTSKLTLKLAKTLELTDDILALKLSPDGKLVAAALLDNTVKIFFVDTLKFFLSLYGHKLPVLSVDISYDSKLLITCSADKNIKIWGLDFGDCHKSIFAHQDSIMSVAFEPETHNFFSVSKDKKVKYWDGDKFVNIQTLSGHHSEVWSLAVARNGEFIVSGSHDKSIRVWEHTDEPLFIEEEREKELEELYESNLTLEEEDEKSGPGIEGEDEVSRAGQQTLETLKAGERIIEALEIGAKDLEDLAEYEARKTVDAEAAAPTRSIILMHLNLSAERYVLDVFEKIKPNHLEDALLVLPFQKAVDLFKFIRLWANKGWNTPLVCKVLSFTLQVHHKQLVASKDTVRPLMQDVQRLIREELQKQRNIIGYNMAGLQYIKQSWDYAHNKEYMDDDKYREDQEKQLKKRFFTSV